MVTETRIVAALAGGPVAEVTSRMAELEAEYGPGLLLTQVRGYFVVFTAGDDDPFACWCATCEGKVLDALPGAARLMRTMCVCNMCGSKRCPRANHHGNACTRSNDPGQPGSAYPARTNRLEHIDAFMIARPAPQSAAAAS